MVEFSATERGRDEQAKKAFVGHFVRDIRGQLTFAVDVIGMDRKSVGEFVGRVEIITEIALYC